jgi:hypothetical protein
MGSESGIGWSISVTRHARPSSGSDALFLERMRAHEVTPFDLGSDEVSRELQ